jgi:hypothetical protein
MLRAAGGSDRKFWWSATFFVWSAYAILVLDAFPVYDRWLQFHPSWRYSSSVASFAAFAGFMAAGILSSSWIFILAVINGLVLRRYKSRIAAALFIALGLWGLWLGALVLWQGIVPFGLMMALFFGAYFFIAVWMLVLLIRRQRELQSGALR